MGEFVPSRSASDNPGPVADDEEEVEDEDDDEEDEDKDDEDEDEDEEFVVAFSCPSDEVSDRFVRMPSGSSGCGIPAAPVPVPDPSFSIMRMYFATRVGSVCAGMALACCAAASAWLISIPFGAAAFTTAAAAATAAGLLLLPDTSYSRARAVATSLAVMRRSFTNSKWASDADGMVDDDDDIDDDVTRFLDVEVKERSVSGPPPTAVGIEDKPGEEDSTEEDEEADAE